MCGTVIGGHAVSSFHGMGLRLLMFTVRLFRRSRSEGELMFCFGQIGTGTTTAVFKPSTPPTFPTPDLVYTGSFVTKR